MSYKETSVSILSTVFSQLILNSVILIAGEGLTNMVNDITQKSSIVQIQKYFPSNSCRKNSSPVQKF